MKLKKGFIVHTNKDESLLVPLAGAHFSGIVRGNKTMGHIMNLLQEDTTEEQVIKKMHDTFEAPAGAIEKDVRTVIEQLKKIGALE